MKHDGAEVDELFQAREARGVATALLARIAFLFLGVLAIPVTATNMDDAARTGFYAAFGITVNGLALYWVRKRAHVTRAGLLGVAFDVCGIVLLPLSWYAAVGGPDGIAAAFLTKTDLAYIGFVMIAINTLTLRPLYPLIVASAMALWNAILVILALFDDRTILTTDPIVAQMGPGIHPMFLAWSLICTLIAGGLAASIAWTARAMVAEAVQAQVERSRLLAREAERIAAAQLGSLTRLVAGLAHEINTPLGTLLSGAASSQAAADRLTREITNAESLGTLRRDRLERVLGALSEVSGASKLAGARLKELVAALKTFARLDESDWVDTDVNETLDATLALVPAELHAGVDITNDRSDVPKVHCRAREIGQVFMTIIENALEALEGNGRLDLCTRLEGESVVVRIEDNGPGMTDAVRESLFDLNFQPKQGRMGMGLGLPVGRRIVRQHGGEISVASTLGAGVRFEVRLPLRPDDV